MVKKGLFPEGKSHNIGLVNGILSGSTFGCFADRQERPPGQATGQRPSRTRGAFRKNACPAKRACWPTYTPFPANSRTTTLGPFGELIRATGSMAKVNPIRFSPKYDDDKSDLLYYGYRYYKPSTGTWVSRVLYARAFADAGYKGWPGIGSQAIPATPIKYLSCATCGKVPNQNLFSVWPHDDWGFIWPNY